MNNSRSTPLKYNWENDVEPYLDSLQHVSQGYTQAKRGIVALKDGVKVFVKIGVDEQTIRWLKKEVFVYQRLNSAQFAYAPTLLAVSKNTDAMAIEYLGEASFENIWDEDKVTALLIARKELKKVSYLFGRNLSYMQGEDTLSLGDMWSYVCSNKAVEKLNTCLKNLGANLEFDLKQLKAYQNEHKGWSLYQNTLVHLDIRADNFAYSPTTKQGQLIDWNHLCYGDDSLDLNPAFINMRLSGFDPYKTYPEAYDRKTILYLISFWLKAIATGSVNPESLEKKRRIAQIAQLKICLELIDNPPR